MTMTVSPVPDDCSLRRFSCLIAGLSILSIVSCSESTDYDGVSARHATSRRAALAKIEELGGIVPHEMWERDDKPVYCFRLLDITFGEDWRGGNNGLALLKDVRAAYEVILDSPEIDDAGLPYVAEMERLEGLTCKRTVITDTGLQNASGIQGLKLLRFDGARVTPAGFTALSSHNLMWLLVDNAEQFTDAELIHLAGMRDLISLRLNGSAIMGPGLAHLGALQQLRVLDLSDAQVDDDGLAKVAQFSRLRRLDLSGTKVQGSGLVHLQKLARLEELVLDGTPVDDAALQSLSGSSSLMFLSAINTHVTAEGAATIRA